MRVLGKIKHTIDWYILGGKQRHAAFMRQREINQHHRYDYPFENNGWKKVGSAPVYGDKETGTIFDPQVIVHNGKFLMTASERKSGCIILLVSNDGIRWEYECTLLQSVPGTWEHVVNRSCLRNINGVWHLWYTGQNGDKSRIGHLVAPALDKFIRPKINKPVLSPTMDNEGDSVMNPCVILNEQKVKFQMWYAAGETYEPDVLMYAESEDGVSWHKYPKPVLAKDISHPWESYKVGGCDVIRKPAGSYLMYYIGYQNMDVARICFAISNDGLQWERPNDNYCLSPSPNAWDADAVYKPTIAERNGKLYLWYNGRNANEEYIGMAEKILCA